MKTPKKTTLSWKPKRAGKRYCSPGCGAGCTWDAYQRALDEAHALARACGPGWGPRVWENMGWHWCAVYPATAKPHQELGAVYPNTPGNTFWAKIAESFTADGKKLSYQALGKTPRAAIRKATAELRAKIERLVSCLEGLR